MTTSQLTSFLSEIVSGQQIPIGKLAYFRARLSNKIHELVLTEYMRLEREGKINKAELARRTGRKPEQITRWLGAAGNWTIDTFSDLLLGMGCEPALSVTYLANANKTNDVVDQVQIAPIEHNKPESNDYQSLGRLSFIESKSTTQAGGFLPMLSAGSELTKRKPQLQRAA